jgi:hypothetical protein
MVRTLDLEALPQREYAYLLGLYLGDGCISEHRREVWRLRIVLDAAYPGIVEECRRSLAAVRPIEPGWRLSAT